MHVAAADAAEKAEAKARGKGEDEDTVAQKAAEAAERATPRPKAQRNFTDPESKIMLTGDGSFAQCYNGQAVVDAAHQIIVAAEVNDCAADVGNLIPMTEQAISNTGQAPKQMLADAGYCSAANLAASAEVTGEQGTEFFIATGRQRSGEPAPIAPPGTDPGQRHGQAAHGPQARHEERPSGLRPAQSDRRTGLRTDEHPAERQATPDSRSGRRPR